NSLETLLAHFTSDPVSELCVCSYDRLRHIWLDRRHVRRQEQSRTKSTLLMNVVDDLRPPNVVNFVDGDLSFDLRERVPVAIVIVARVLVIELRRISAFERRAEGSVVPVLDDIHAVRIE